MGHNYELYKIFLHIFLSVLGVFCRRQYSMSSYMHKKTTLAMKFLSWVRHTMPDLTLVTLVRLCPSTAGRSPPPTLSIAVYHDIFSSSWFQRTSLCQSPILFLDGQADGGSVSPRRCACRSACCQISCLCVLPIFISFQV